MEDPEFVELLTSLNDKVSILSACTVSRDIQEVFEASQECVKDMLHARIRFLDSILHLMDKTGYSWKTTSLYRRVDIPEHFFVHRYCCTLDTGGENAETRA